MRDSVNGQLENPWRGTGHGAPVETRHITRTKRLYQWAPGPMPLQVAGANVSYD